jgi:hypothetical protein
MKTIEEAVEALNRAIAEYRAMPLEIRPPWLITSKETEEALRILQEVVVLIQQLQGKQPLSEKD